MKKLVLLLLIVMVIIPGCAAYRLTCRTNCLDQRQAMNKCAAQANTAFSKEKPTIWRQCMIGEGYEFEPCDPSKSGPDCRYY